MTILEIRAKQSRRGWQSGLVCATAALALSACGGGGGDSDDGPTAEGVYSGTLTGSTDFSNFSALILEDGQFWSIYGNLSGGTIFVYGLLQGQGTSSDGRFTASNVKDFGVVPAITGSITASYMAGQSITGTLSTSAGSIGFNGTVAPTTNYKYNDPAVIADVAGAWTLDSTSGNTIAVNISSTGAFTGVDDSGCQLSGTLTPRASGKRVFNVQMTFGPAPCGLPGQTASGIALYSSPDTGGTQLTVAVIDGTRSYGTVSFGLR